MTLSLTCTPSLTAHDAAQLLHEHHVLLRQLAAAQRRCSALVSQQAAALLSLQAETLRLRAAVIVRDSALAWARADLMALQSPIAPASRRAAPTPRAKPPLDRDQDGPSTQTGPHAPPVANTSNAGDTGAVGAVEDLAGLEASLVAADLVICQTGCLSHGAYWRVQDHCARTGKACVLVGTADALRIVRIHKPHDGVAQAVQLATDDGDGPRTASCAGVRQA